MDRYLTLHIVFETVYLILTKYNKESKIKHRVNWIVAGEIRKDSQEESPGSIEQ